MGQSWHRCTGHKDETAAPRLNIAQMISSTHVSIEPAVALETHPPSSASSSITTITNFFIKLSSTKQQTRGQRWSQLEQTSTMLGGGARVNEGLQLCG